MANISDALLSELGSAARRLKPEAVIQVSSPREAIDFNRAYSKYMRSLEPKSCRSCAAPGMANHKCDYCGGYV